MSQSICCGDLIRADNIFVCQLKYLEDAVESARPLPARDGAGGEDKRKLRPEAQLSSFIGSQEGVMRKIATFTEKRERGGDI